VSLDETFVRTSDGALLIKDAGSDVGLQRMLLVAATFAPSSAVGSLRWEKLSWFLHEARIALDVVTMHPDEAEAVDLSRLDRLPPSTRVVGVKSGPSAVLRTVSQLHALKAKLSRASDATAPMANKTAVVATPSTRDDDSGLVRTADLPLVPRTRREWARLYRGWLSRAQEAAWYERAVTVGMRLHSDHRYAAVLSSGPPNGSHLAAAAVAERFGTPFVMDMRDPWGTAVAVLAGTASRYDFALARRRERRCVARAAAVVVNTPLARQLLAARYPRDASRFVVVMNGTDTDAAMAPAEQSKFLIVFAGSIYFDRNPRFVFRAAARVIREIGLSPAEFGFEFIGAAASYGGTSTATIAAEEGIGDYVRVEGLIPRSQLLERLRRASMLLSLPQDVETSIPAKIFEYMSFSAWLLILAAAGTATAQLLDGTGADVVDPSSVEAIALAIATRVTQFRQGVRPRPVGDDSRFSRAAQAQILLDRLAKLDAPESVKR
jgi:glycosyltransferase involved in cell wall biosynthesis